MDQDLATILSIPLLSERLIQLNELFAAVCESREQFRSLCPELPSLFVKIFGFGGKRAWLSVAEDSDNAYIAMLSMLTPSGPLFSALVDYAEDSEVMFEFPVDKLPAITQHAIATRNFELLPKLYHSKINYSMYGPAPVPPSVADPNMRMSTLSTLGQSQSVPLAASTAQTLPQPPTPGPNVNVAPTGPTAISLTAFEYYCFCFAYYACRPPTAAERNAQRQRASHAARFQQRFMRGQRNSVHSAFGVDYSGLYKTLILEYLSVLAPYGSSGVQSELSHAARVPASTNRASHSLIGGIGSLGFGQDKYAVLGQVFVETMTEFWLGQGSCSPLLKQPHVQFQNLNFNMEELMETEISIPEREASEACIILIKYLSGDSSLCSFDSDREYEDGDGGDMDTVVGTGSSSTVSSRKAKAKERERSAKLKMKMNLKLKDGEGEGLGNGLLVNVIQPPLYQFIRSSLNAPGWPVQASTPLWMVIDMWLAYIQPWRLDQKQKQKQKQVRFSSPTGAGGSGVGVGGGGIDADDGEFIDKWAPFISRNALMYLNCMQDFLFHCLRQSFQSPDHTRAITRVGSAFGRAKAIFPLLIDIDATLPSVVPFSMSSLLSTSTSVSASASANLHQNQSQRLNLNLLRNHVVSLEGQQYAHTPVLSSPSNIEMMKRLLRMISATSVTSRFDVEGVRSSVFSLFDNEDEEGNDDGIGSFGNGSTSEAVPLRNSEYGKLEKAGEMLAALFQVSVAENMMYEGNGEGEGEGEARRKTTKQSVSVKRRQRGSQNGKQNLSMSQSHSHSLWSSPLADRRNAAYRGKEVYRPIASYEIAFLVRLSVALSDFIASMRGKARGEGPNLRWFAAYSSLFTVFCVAVLFKFVWSAL